MKCPICSLRISEWEVTHKKVLVLYEQHVHKSCLIDFKLRNGGDWKPWKGNDGEDDGS